MAKRTASKTQLIKVLQESGQTFKFCAKKTKILSALAWKQSVAEEFFRSKETNIPKPTYSVDAKAMQECLEALAALKTKIQGDHPVFQMLNRMHESYVLGSRLLLEIEKPGFYEVSTQLYGNSQSRPFNGSTTNLELARAINARMSVCALNDIRESNTEQSAADFAAHLAERLKGRRPDMPVKVELSDDIVSKVVAGMSRVRIRADARFSRMELEALWNHEIESHCLTAHNGDNQKICDFLIGGGPRTTMTQEGLAVFYEVYGHTMSQQRFLTLCDRIEAVHLAEQGAGFIDVYRWYLDRNETPIEAFYNAQRIFRGSVLTGGSPFTKDTVYLAGLIGVYNFLRIAVKNQNRVLVESLVSGRLALEDVGTIAWLRTHGIMDPPKHVPTWLENWESLLSFFSLSAVLGNLDLANFQGYFDEYYTLESWDLSL